VPNRRRRRLSIATSAVVALAVASPIAVIAVSELSASTKPAPQHREFVQAAMITDLPGELISALSQGLSQFGINLPPMPTGLLTGSGSSAPTTLTSPGLGAMPGLGTTPLAPSSLGSAPLTTPGVGLPSVPATLPDAALANPALTNPALTSPTGTPPLGAVPPTPGLTTTTPGLTTPPAITDPGLTPISATGLPGEVPISAPIGLDPVGTYPILGDPSLATMPASTGSGGLIGDLSSMANQLGAGQAIDLLKGMVMPAIMSAVKPGALPGAPAAVPPAPAAPITHAVGTTAPAGSGGAASSPVQP
jgi:hypothetical protein